MQPGAFWLAVGGQLLGCGGAVEPRRVPSDEPCVTSWYYSDGDRDGLGGFDNVVESCEAPPGYVSNHDDCDDTRADIGRAEVGLLDRDGDGYTGYQEGLRCPLPDPLPGDCDDDDSSVHPGAPEQLDSRDQDCDVRNDELEPHAADAAWDVGADAWIVPLVGDFDGTGAQILLGSPFTETVVVDPSIRGAGPVDDATLWTLPAGVGEVIPLGTEDVEGDGVDELIYQMGGGIRVGPVGPTADPLSPPWSWTHSEWLQVQAIGDVEGNGTRWLSLTGDGAAWLLPIGAPETVDLASTSPTLWFGQSANPDQAAGGDTDGDGLPEVAFAIGSQFGERQVALVHQVPSVSTRIEDAADATVTMDKSAWAQDLLPMFPGDLDGDGYGDLGLVDGTYAHTFWMLPGPLDRYQTVDDAPLRIEDADLWHAFAFDVGDDGQVDLAVQAELVYLLQGPLSGVVTLGGQPVIDWPSYEEPIVFPTMSPDSNGDGHSELVFTAYEWSAFNYYGTPAPVGLYLFDGLEWQ